MKRIIWPTLLITSFIIAGCNSGTGQDSISSHRPLSSGAFSDCIICHSSQNSPSLDPLTTNGTGTDGKHILHVANRGIGCEKCHQHYTDQITHMNGIVDTGNPAVNLINFDSINPNGKWINDTGPQQGSCSYLACHGPDTPDWYSASETLPTCKTCHIGSLDPTSTNGSGTSGKHILHVNKRGIDCIKCHFHYTDHATHMNGTLDTTNPAVYLVYFDSTNPNGQWNKGTEPGTGRCSSLACHGADTPDWYGASESLPVCLACHTGNLDPSSIDSPPAGKHTTHVKNRGIDCVTCHYGYPNQMTHMNGTINYFTIVSFSTLDNPNGSWTSGGQPQTGNCSNIYCHSAAQTANGGPLTTSDYERPAWGVDVMTCTSCHNYPPSSGSHGKHAGSGVGQYAFPCGRCHKGYVPPQTTANHVDGAINTAMDTGGEYRGDTIPGNGFSNCSNTYCHSDGTGGTKNIAICAPLTPPDLRPVATNISPTWDSSGPLACNSCHGGPNVNGMPVSTPQKSDLHYYHATYGVSQCNWCHFDTVDSNNQIKNPLKHANGYYDVVPNTSVVFGGTTTIGFTYQYRQSGGRCYDNNCHPSVTHTWGWPNVVNINPTASSTAFRTNLTVTYTVTASDLDYNYCDHSGNGTIYVYWGDGGNGDTQSVSLTDIPTDFVFTHTYATCNSYNIQATVTDNAGGTAQAYSTVDTRYSVYGTVTHGSPATGLAGTTMYLQYQLSSGGWTTQKSTTTASDGSYSFTLNCPGTYRVLPIMSGETFSPTISPNFTLGPDATGVNFTATP